MSASVRRFSEHNCLTFRTLLFAAVLTAGTGCSDGPGLPNPMGGYDGPFTVPEATGGTGSVTVVTETVTFSSNSAVTADAKWGDDNAKLTVSHVGNLNAGLAIWLAAAVDGIPCSAVQMSDTDSTALELTCSIPPGSGRKPKPKLVIKSPGYTASMKLVYVDMAGGTFDVPVKECDPPAPPTSGVALPQLCRADPGSTADVGKPYEGKYMGRQIADDSSSVSGLMVAADGTYLGGYLYDGNCRAGKLIPTEESWTPQGSAFTTESGISASSNTFTASNWKGVYAPYKSIADYSASSDDYSVSNALAVTPASVSGTWSQDSYTSLTIVVSGDTGTITGTDQGCSLNGTVRLHEPGSAKNLYDITLTASPLPDTGNSYYYECDIPGDAVLTGFAAIDFVNTGTDLNPVYAYTLDYAAYQIDKFVVSGRLIKK